MKCDKCVWAEKRTGTKTFCPFPACVKKPKRLEKLKGAVRRK